MENMTDQKMRKAIEEAQFMADKANRDFNANQRSITARAGRSFDVSDMNDALALVRDVKSYADDCYASFETAIRVLDMTCRPLLAESPSAAVVRDVGRVISGLVKEASDISVDFTGSLNGISLGDIGTVKYTASIEARTIQKFWEAAYRSMPGRIELEKEERKAEEKKQEQLRQKAEQKKAELNRKIQEYNDAKKAQDEEKQKCKARIDKEFSAQIEELKRRLEQTKDELEIKKSALRKETSEADIYLKSLGLFSFTKKQKAKEKLSELQAGLSAVESEISQRQFEYERAVTRLKDDQARRERDEFAEIEKRIPVPEDPQKPESDTLDAAILRCLKNEGYMTQTEIMESLSSEYMVSNLRMNRALRGLVSSKRIRSMESEGHVYYWI